MTQRLSDLADTLMWPRPVVVPPTTLPHTVTINTDWLWVLIPLVVVGIFTLLDAWVMPVYRCVKSRLRMAHNWWLVFWASKHNPRDWQF